MITMKTKVSLVLAAAGALLVTGCAQEQDEINRVQPNYTQKAELKGEFYFRSTVVEAPYTSLGFFVGNQNYQLERGIFDIQEDNLYFYRTYELMIGGETLGSNPEVDTPLYQTDDNGNIIIGEDGKPVPVVYQRRVGNELLTFQRFVYRGSPILVIPISRHFDIQREYNALTGEQTNVIAENTTDRQWHERKYMRVEWGRSQFDHADRNIFPQQGIYGAFAPPSEVIDETYAESDRPVKELGDDGTIQYLDYQVRSVFAAPTAYLESYGTIPACWYYPWYLGQVAECISERVTFRHSFLKVQDSDYVAWDYPDDKLKKFAYYRMERAQYDAVRGTTFTGVSRRIRRFRIWENYVVSQGDACELSAAGDAQGTCGAGEFCEQFDNGAFCVANDANDRLDYSQMEPKPIVWYVSEGFPRDLIVHATGLAENWNGPFVDVVNFRKPDAEVSQMFVMCENNLTEATAAMEALGLDINNADDVRQAQEAGQLAMIDAPCANMENAKRNGDLRYSQLHAIVEPISYGLLGYGPSSADPLSGEMISANSYMYLGAMKRQANMGMVAIEITTGIRNFWETTYGNHISEKLMKTRLGAASGGLPKYSVDSARAVAKTMLSEDVARRVDSMAIPTSDSDWAADRMAILARNAPDIAKMFVTDDIKLARKDPTLGTASNETTDETLDRLGMHKWANFNGHVKDMYESYDVLNQDGCRYMAEFTDPAILGLAREYGGRVNDYVCGKARELSESADGATVFDFQEFEQLQGTCETENVESEDGLLLCEAVDVDGSGNTALYWTNPCSVGKLKIQLAQAVVELEQTNPYNLTQDYFPPDPVYTDTKHQVVNDSQVVLINAIDEVRTELHNELYRRIFRGVAEHEVGHSIGLRHNFEGSTDALNFGEDYWKLKGQFDDSGEFQAYDLFAPETFYQSSNGLRQLQSASVMDYSAKFNDRFEGVGYYDRAAVRYGYGGLVEVFNNEPNVSKFDAYMADPQVADPNNVPVMPDIGSTYLERMFKRVHYTNIPELFPNELSKLYDRSFVRASSITESGKDANGRWEVPYRMCSDELAGKLPTCERWDSGVDSFEIVRNTLTDYEQYWPIYGYWHDSVLFQPDGYYNRVVRMFQMLKSQMQWWVVQRNFFNHDDWWEQRFGTPWHEDVDGGLVGSVSIADSVNTMASTFGRPQPGQHGYRTTRDVFEPVPFQDSSAYSNYRLVTPNNCEARPLYASYDYGGYLPIVTRSGAIYDRLAAFEMLADPTSNFIAADKRQTSAGSGFSSFQYSDIERQLISFYSLFPKELTNLYGAMTANKTDSWGWYMVTNQAGNPDRCHRRNVVGPDAVTIAELEATEGTTVWAFNPEPEYTFPTTRFRLPMLAAYYGLGWFLDGWDKNFVDITRVYLDGHLGAVTPSDDAEVLSFTDPLSGKTYSAVRSQFNSDVIHPAYNMIEQMQAELESYGSVEELQANYNYSEYQFILDKLELLRGMNYAYDYNE